MLSEAEVEVVRKSAEGIATQSQSPGLEMMRMAAQAMSATTEVQAKMQKFAEAMSEPTELQTLRRKATGSLSATTDVQAQRLTTIRTEVFQSFGWGS
jgi:hypothetical protein